MAFSAAFTTAFRAAFSDLAAGLTFLLRDDFVTTESAPLASPRTCEPGPGALTGQTQLRAHTRTLSSGGYLNGI
jgi:hypothetical protein